MATESPSLLLQRAANKLEELASDAHLAKAPWTADGSIVWAADDYLVLGGAPWDNDREPDPDADWIATMSPAIVAPLVAWLRSQAELIRQQWHPGSPSYEPWPSVQFARLILGASSSDEEPS